MHQPSPRLRLARPSAATLPRDSRGRGLAQRQPCSERILAGADDPQPERYRSTSNVQHRSLLRRSSRFGCEDWTPNFQVTWALSVGSPAITPIYGCFGDDAAPIRPHMNWFRRHESDMQTTSSIRISLHVPRGTIRNDLMFPRTTADYSDERGCRPGVIMALSAPVALRALRSGPFASLASRPGPP